MYVNIRNCYNSEELQIKTSKSATIRKLKEEIEKQLNIKPELQRLFYSGKHLEEENALNDYKINLNDTIQLIIRPTFNDLQNYNTSHNDATTFTYKEKEKEENKNLVDVESNYYRIGDAIDCIDLKYGAWFEATILRICCENGELVYIVKWDLVEYAQPFYVSENSIRPRAWEIIPKNKLVIGQKIMLNYNLDDPSQLGHWYDFEIKNISVKRNKYILFGSLLIGNNGQSLNDLQIILKSKVYAIEKPKLLKDRNKDDLNKISRNRRVIAPECFKCFDKLDVKCTMCGCKICGGKNDPHKIILCDECEDEYHIGCLKPPLQKVPEEDWYCPKCKNNENEIIKMGDKIKKRFNKNSKSDRNWGSGMSCAGRSKHCTIVKKNHRGPIPGIEVGSCWWSRIQVSEAGVHIPPVAGIHGRESDCAYSIVLSGGYGDIDNGLEFIYTGSGGRDLSGNKRTAVQSSHQTLTRANKALALNCKAKFNDKVGAEAHNWKAGIPVRVVRNYKLSKYSDYAPKEGNRYDGIYKVVKYYPELNEDGFLLWRYLLRRDDPVPPPWTPEGRKRIKELGLKIQYPDGFARKNLAKSFKTIYIKNKININKPPKKKQKIEPYDLDSNVSELIEKDIVNLKLWKDCKQHLSNGKVFFLNHVSKSLQCVCCHDLVFKPVTTPCNHNICQNCLKRSLQAGVNFCPICRYKLEKNVKIPINKELAMILILLFPGYERGRK